MDAYFALLKDCGDAVVVADHLGQVVFTNSVATHLLGGQVDILLNKSDRAAYQIFQVDAITETRTQEFPLRRALEGERFSDREFLLRSPTSDLNTWLSITGYPVALETPPFRGGMLIIRDITTHKTIAQQKLRATFRDKLTGLVNRPVFMDRVGHALTRAHRRDTEWLVVVLSIDIERFKSVNDTLGYIFGDQFLAAFGDRLTQVLRPEDTVCRLGGDQFTVLLEDMPSYSAVVAIADQVHAAMTQPFHILGRELQVEISIGIALANATGQQAETLIRKADLAMYQAKETFAEKYYVYEDSLQLDTSDTLYLEMALRKAVDNQEFVLEYQPIFQISTREVLGVESLVRWQHPERGQISPAEFIPLAEKTGLIIPLGWWVFEESCRQLKFWQDAMPHAANLFVSINMSSKQFAQKNAVQKIKDILDQVGLNAHCLKIEITESVLIDQSVSIIEKLKAIRAIGIKLSIDDFGTGYSSLSYLHRFPFDTLKLDRSFLEDADADYEKLEILQSVVRLAWNLGLEVVAEGIETEQHYARIKALRCEAGQGFLFSPPLSAIATEALIQAQGRSV